MDPGLPERGTVRRIENAGGELEGESQPGSGGALSLPTRNEWSWS